MLVGQLEEAGLPDRTAPLLREARLVLDTAKKSLTLEADYERLCDQAARWLAPTQSCGSEPAVEGAADR
jgi:hypothetical protein